MSLRDWVDNRIKNVASPIANNVDEFRSTQTSNAAASCIGQILSISGGTAQIYMSDQTTQSAAIGLRTVSVGDTVTVIGGMIF